MSKLSLYNKLVDYSKSDYYPFHMPGHKRNHKIMSMVNPYEIDITEIENFDNLHNAKGVIKELEERISRIYSVTNTHILVNGSSCGIMAGICATTHEKDNVIIARNCHKAVYNTIEIRKLNPYYLCPKISKEYGYYNAIGCEEMEEAFKVTKNVSAVVITSPSYEGIISDISGIAKIVHKNNAILIVDEAHGAHFGLSGNTSKSAISLGADVVIRSVHKTLPSMTQTAIMHINTNKVSDEKILKYLSFFESSSPSYVLMSSVDKCFGIIENCGKELIKEYYRNLSDFYVNTNKLKNIYILGNKFNVNHEYERNQEYELKQKHESNQEYELKQEHELNLKNNWNINKYDYGKIVIVVNNCKREGKEYDGQSMYTELLDKYHLQLEMSSKKYVIAMTSFCDTKEGLNRLSDALKEIDKSLYLENKIDQKNYTKNKINQTLFIKYKTDQTLSNENEIDVNSQKTPCPRRIKNVFELDESKKMWININNAKNKISGEYIYLYPPGSPIIIPGEEFNSEILLTIGDYLQRGLNIIGIKDNKVCIEKE